jgi:capsule polysaccharide export protein KpsE/RkpR
MKLTKSALRQMIKEAADDVAKVKAGRTTASSSQRQFRDRAKEKNAEVSPQENSIIQQVLDALTKIASAPEVELGRHRPQISALLKKLQSITGAELGGAEEEASEEIQEL